MRLRRLITVDKNKLVKRRVVCIQLCIGKGILADRVSIASEPSRPLLFFCHGGGWVFANRSKSERVLCDYALKTNSVVTYIDYRLSPEYKHPTASNDCYDCLMVGIVVTTEL